MKNMQVKIYPVVAQDGIYYYAKYKIAWFGKWENVTETKQSAWGSYGETVIKSTIKEMTEFIKEKHGTSATIISNYLT